MDDAGPGGNGTAAELQRLADLHRGGALTDTEFAAATEAVVALVLKGCGVAKVS